MDAETKTGMDLSGACPGLYAALSRAQGMVGKVGKDGKNSQAGYKYATAEAMMIESQKVLAANGLAFFSMWCRDPAPEVPGDIGNQFVCASVRVHWCLSWAAGKVDEGGVVEASGVITGTAEMDAVGSPRRPPDKAVAATLTYMRGFILRDILNMPRGEDVDSVDRREEGGYQHRGRPPQRQQQRAAPASQPNTARDTAKIAVKLVIDKSDGWKWADVAACADVPPITTGYTADDWARLEGWCLQYLEEDRAADIADEARKSDEGMG